MSRLEFCKRQIKKFGVWKGVHQSVDVPEWVTLGNNVTIYEGVILGAEGFGYARDVDGSYLHIPQRGNVVIEDNVDIFYYSQIERATVDETRICSGTKIDSNCHIGHNSRIGRNCIITAHSVIGGSAVIGDNVWIGMNSTILNKLKIGDNVYIGSNTNVIRDVPDDAVVVGNPSRILRIGDQPHLKIL